MKSRHAAALALVGWYLVVPVSSLAGTATRESTYTNDAYGILFQYPSDWILKEGDSFKLDWGYLGLVETALPHGTTVVIVSFPCKPCDTSGKVLDATDFMQVRVDPKLTPAQCNQSSFTGFQASSLFADDPEPGKFPTGRVGTIEFTEAQLGLGAMGHQAISRYYHVFPQRCLL
jgi:hypothetical protein